MMSEPKLKYIALSQLYLIYVLLQEVLHSKIHNQFSYILLVLATLMKYVSGI